MPAPAWLDAGTASQLIRGVRWAQELPRGQERMDGMLWRRVRSLAQVIAVTFAVSGIVALLGSRGRHPSWVVFFIVALLVWLAYR